MYLCSIALYIIISQLYFSTAVDHQQSCQIQQKEIHEKLSNQEFKTKFVSMFVFPNETKPLLLLAWAGNHTIVVVTLRTQGLVTRESDVYRSTNDGRTFERITDRIAPGKQLLVMQANGLQRNPIDPRRIYLVCYDPATLTTSLVFHTSDSGANWSESRLGFLVQSPFQFHPTRTELLLVQVGTAVHVSKNAGKDWSPLKDRVFKASWGVGKDSADAVYAAVDASNGADPAISFLWDSQLQQRRTPGRQLVKTVDYGKSWNVLAESIYSFSNKGDFVFISKADSGSTDYRHLEVSIDFGASFARTHLPSATPDKFFAILDMSEDIVLVHIGAGNFLGQGTLYASNSLGRVFSKSLERHLYPPIGSGSDFYKVESMRGTYLTTVLREDKSMQSVVTHSRGAMWRHLAKPEGAVCSESSDSASNVTCSLQVASQYSISRGVAANPPVSAATAAGLAIVHGHAAASLQSNASDVFVSSDGGYSWYRALAGPHHVLIGNNGNFLVAIPLGEASPQVLKFSTDAGRCWHSHRFTSETFRFTGLLAEPGNRALTVAIWGFVSETSHWRIYVVDLGQLLTRQCTDSDYESWLTNGAVSSGSGESERACVFGAKETIKRLKPDSMCNSDYSYSPSTSVQACECTKEDFECEFGYTRPVNSQTCVPDPDVKVPEICDADTVKKIVTEGYRKLPGNRCQDGFQPNVTQQVILRRAKCSKPMEEGTPSENPKAEEATPSENPKAEEATPSENPKAEEATPSENPKAEEATPSENPKAEEAKSWPAVLIPLSITVALLLCAFLLLVILFRLRERRRRRLDFHYTVVFRHADANIGNLEFQPADGSTLNCVGQQPPGCNTRAAPAGMNRDKQHLLGDEDGAPIC